MTFASDTLVVVAGANWIELVHLAAGRPQKESIVGVDVVSVGVSNPASHPLVEALLRLAALIGSDVVPSLQPKRRRLAVVISDRWIATATLPWSDSLAMTRDADAYARMFLGAAGRRVQPGDQVVLDDAPSTQLRLAVAYPAAIVAALAVFAESLNAELTSLLPLSAVAWNSVPRQLPAGALAVIEDGARTIANGHRRLFGVTVRGTDPSQIDSRAGSTALLDQWQRMRMRDRQLDSAGPLRVLDLRSDASGTSDVGCGPGATSVGLPEFAGASDLPRSLRLAVTAPRLRLAIDGVGKRVALSTTQRALVLVAVAAATVATVHAWRVGESTEALRRAAAAQPQAVQEPLAVWAPDQMPRVRAVNAAISDLNTPVLDLISRLAPPRDLPVSILSVDVPPATAHDGDAIRTVKIVAEAESADDMTRYVSFVAERKRLSTAYLSRHDRSADDKRPYRFTVEATWAP